MNKTVYAIMAILFNGLGVPSFMLGKTKQGVLHIVLSAVTCGVCSVIFTVLGIIAGVKALQMTDEQFEQEKENIKISFLK